ncbi:DUF4112 domain-containing protein [Halobacteriaceae archaeon GCM10025711]
MSNAESTASNAEPVHVVEEDDGETVERLERLSFVLDNAVRVPGTSYRVGLDPLVGLLPGIGDVPTTAVSAYIVVEAAAMGVPRATVARMVFNLVVDAVFGSIPIAGDLFDAVWKANARNVGLLEARLDDPGAQSADRRFLWLAGGGLFVVLLALSAGVVVLLAWLVRSLGGLPG